MCYTAKSLHFDILSKIQNIYQLVCDVLQPVRISAGYKQPRQLYQGLPAKNQHCS